MMVAEVVEPEISQPIARNRSGRAPELPILTVARVRNLYLGHFLGLNEIAERTGLNVDQVRNLVSRRGWTKLKAKRRQTLEEKAIARVEETTQQIVEAVAMESEELTLGSLRASHGVLAKVGTDKGRDAPRDLQALSQAAKNFVGIFRQARGLDASANAQQGGQTLNLSMFFLGGSALQSTPAIVATQQQAQRTESSNTAIDVAASEVSSESVESNATPELAMPAIEAAVAPAAVAVEAPPAPASAPTVDQPAAQPDQDAPAPAAQLDFYAMRAAQRAKRAQR